MSIGKKLIKLRADRKLTQQEVADYLNIARQTVSKWENDKTLPPLETLQELCKLYQTNISELMDSHQSETTVKSTYLEIQKTLENIQHQNKKRQYLSYVLMVLCLISLSASVYVNHQFKTYKENLYRNSYYLYEDAKINHFKHIYEDRNLFSSTQENPTYIKVNQIDIGKKEAEIEGQFILKKYSDQTSCTFVFNEGDLPEKRYPLTKINKNTFTLTQIIPFKNYSSVYLEIDDGNGKKTLERLDVNPDNVHISIFDMIFNVHDATTTIYIPVDNNQLKLDTIVYEPNLTLYKEGLFVGDYFQEGTISIRLYNEDEQMIFNEEIPLSERHEFKLEESLMIGQTIYCGYSISVSNVDGGYGMFRGMYETNYGGEEITLLQQSEPKYLYRYE